MPQYAERVLYMEKTAEVVRGLFQSMTDPEIISFSGGAPAAEALPVDLLREIANDVIRSDSRGIEAMQYGKPSGSPGLRQAVADTLLRPHGLLADPEEIMIVSGGLETVNLLCQMFINPGDVILVESPSFVHCIEIFDMFQAKCIPVDMDDDGIVPEDLEEKMQKYHPKMAYVIPTFQNPTGRTLSAERRPQVAELGSRYDVLIIEDDPYRDLRYSGSSLPYIKSYDQTGHTVLASSFSKIFSPGARLGFVYAAPYIIRKLYDAKTATNSHAPQISQVLCEEYFRRGYYQQHLEKVNSIYRIRRDAMIESIDRFFPAGSKRVFPEGGLFSWVELPDGINTTELLPAAMKAKVSYVPGEGFFADRKGAGTNCMRLSFGGVAPDRIRQGIEILGNVLKGV